MQVEEFLKYHGGDVAVSHKSQLIHLTGGNVGKLEASLFHLEVSF